MIFQEPMTSLSPVHTIGDQISEAILLHTKATKDEARERAIEMLRQVGIPKPETRVDAYPFQLSGGMRQRAMIAMALSCHPSLLIADEPTTALDVTTQAQILDLMRKLQQERGMAIMFITHDLGVVAEIADEVVVMYLGQVVERGPVDAIFHDPKHPYTQALLRSIPQHRAAGSPARWRRSRAWCPTRTTVPRAAPSTRAAQAHRRASATRCSRRRWSWSRATMCAACCTTVKEAADERQADPTRSQASSSRSSDLKNALPDRARASCAGRSGMSRRSTT